MRQTMSLEEEKRRLLQQLETSRAVYRRMLTDTEDDSYASMSTASYGEKAQTRHSGFPQSHTMRWLMQHPFLIGFGAVAIVVAGRKGWSKTRRKSELPTASSAKDTNIDVKKSLAVTTLGTSIATTAAMLLRNPAQIQAAMRAIGVALNYYKSRRQNARQRFE